MLDLKVLREEYTNLHQSAETLIKKVADEKREMSTDEVAENDKQFKRMTEIKSVMDRQAKLAEHAYSEKKAEASISTVELPSEPAGKEDVEIKVRERFDRKNFDRKEFDSAVNEWFRTGQMAKKFTTITGSTQSGILMPVEVAPPVSPSALNAYREGLTAYGMDAWKTPRTSTYNIPIFTAAAGSVCVGTAVTESENEPALSESVVSVTVTYHSGNIWFENRELESVDFDLMSASVPALAYSKELAFENAISTAIIADGTASTIPTATVTGFTYANMVSLNRSLPKRYNALKVIVLSKAAYTAAENLTTTTGFPILNQDAQNQNLKRFNGTPVVYTETLAAFGANNVIGCIYSWIGARLRDAGPGDVLQRFTQAYTRQGQTGADLYSYNAFNYSSLALVKLVCPAS